MSLIFSRLIALLSSLIYPHTTEHSWTQCVATYIQKSHKCADRQQPQIKQRLVEIDVKSKKQQNERTKKMNKQRNRDSAHCTDVENIFHDDRAINESHKLMYRE